jgi:glycosyltransferase involved in cell wall biosynthesis
VNIGMVCYASVGGSGVVATELAHALALRGHQIHLISSEPPFRWRSGVPGLFFERVEVPPYPLFREPQYLLALANTIARVAVERRLDIVHAHYAVPHATAAYLADQMLAGGDAMAPRTMTTLHGTDITLVGSDRSYAQLVAFSIEQSHGVTAVSRSLKADTVAALGIRQEIRMIPNFLNCAAYRRRFDPELRERLAPAARFDKLVLHVSNFRPVMRVDVALEVFRAMRRRVRAGSFSSATVRFVPPSSSAPPTTAWPTRSRSPEKAGSRALVVGRRSVPAAVAQESFGLAALEAMACGAAVVASNVGGLPEIIEDRVTGFCVRRRGGRHGGSERGNPDRCRTTRSTQPSGRGGRALTLLHRSDRAVVRGRLSGRFGKSRRASLKKFHGGVVGRSARRQTFGEEIDMHTNTPSRRA